MNPFDDDDEEANMPSVSTRSNQGTYRLVSPQPRPPPPPPKIAKPNKPQNTISTSNPNTKADSKTDTKKPETRNSQRIRSKTVCVNPEEENKVIRFLVSKRVYGYPGTDGSWWSNLRQYVMNNHPVISLVFAHPLHPFSMRNRIVVFLCMTLFAITLSFIFYNTTYVPELSMCREGCGLLNETALNHMNATSVNATSTDSFDNYASIHASRRLISANDIIGGDWAGFDDDDASYNKLYQNSSSYCVGGFNNGITRAYWHSHCKYYQPWMLNMIIGAILVPYGSFLKFISTCGCLKGRRFFKTNCVGAWCAGMVDYVGGQVLSIAFAFNLILMVWALFETYFKKIGFQIFVTFLLSKAWSTVLWFGYMVPYYTVKYPFDQRFFYKRLEASQPDDDEGIAMNSLPPRS